MPTGKSPPPEKPYLGFPLFPHQNGQWAKKIRGKHHFFGIWGDHDAALQKYLDERDDLQAGRIPQRVSSGVVNVGSLVNLFLAQWEAKVQSGTISPRTFVDYRDCAKMLIEKLGRSTAADTLAPTNFAGLRNQWASKYSSGRLNKLVTMTRTIFKWSWESDLLKVPVKLGPDFKGASKRQIREQRNAVATKLFEASELQTILKAATPTLRAMILLAVNCGYGNTDIATVKQSHIAGGWVNYPRPKTAVPRRAPLWPETEAAIAEVIQRRPKATNAEDAGLIFLTVHGAPWVRPGIESNDEVSKAFRKLLTRTELYRLGRTFYALRHTFATIGDDARDSVAVAAILGHADASMTANYRQRIEDARLLAVTDHVRHWLFGETVTETKPEPIKAG